MQNISTKAINDLWGIGPSVTLSDKELKFAFNFCRTSPVVSDNDFYRPIADKISFSIDDSNTINAYANIADGTPEICLYQGIVNWSAIFGIIWMRMDEGMSIREAYKMIDWVKQADNRDRGSIQCVLDFCNEFDIIPTTYQCERIRSNTLQMIISVIGHEMGHICLGHLGDGGYDDVVKSANRNIERQADLFGASIMQMGDNVSAAAIGCIMSEMSLLSLGNSSGEYDHPASLERIENFFNSFKNHFISKTMSEKVLRKLVKRAINNRED